MSGTIETNIRKFITDSFMYREGVVALRDDDSLLEKGLIDSTGVLELVFFMEKTFQIKVADDEVIPENLDSIQFISEFIRRKSSAAAEVQVA